MSDNKSILELWGFLFKGIVITGWCSATMYHIVYWELFGVKAFDYITTSQYIVSLGWVFGAIILILGALFITRMEWSFMPITNKNKMDVNEPKSPLKLLSGLIIASLSSMLSSLSIGFGLMSIVGALITYFIFKLNILSRTFNDGYLRFCVLISFIYPVFLAGSFATAQYKIHKADMSLSAIHITSMTFVGNSSPSSTNTTTQLKSDVIRCHIIGHLGDFIFGILMDGTIVQIPISNILLIEKPK